MKYYIEDKNCPARWEPSGEDFLSACLEEALLMQKVLPNERFNSWFKSFLTEENLEHLMIPAAVSDRSDPKIVHLDGLNLSRAWCFFGIAEHLNDRNLTQKLILSGQAHLRASLPFIASEHYEGSHWLGSFAVLALIN